MGSFRLVAGNWLLHQYNNFAGWAVETAPKSLRHSCGSELALAGVAEAWYRIQDYWKALEYYDKALREVKAHFGENMSYAVLCENCAAVCEKLGDDEKLRFYREKAEKVKSGLK